MTNIDQSAKQVLPPAKRLQCIFLRGIINGKKTPIFFDFDTPVTLSLLSDVIQKVKGFGFNIKCCCFDLGNKEFASEVGFFKGKTSIKNPVHKDKEILLMPDVPHMLKLLRNHVITKGVFIPENPFNSKNRVVLEEGHAMKLGRSDFASIIKADKGELKIHHRLKLHHVALPEGFKTSVRGAAQTLSETTAKALEYLFPEEKEKAAVIQVFNDVSTTENTENKYFS